MTRRDAHLHRAKDRLVGQKVTSLAQKHKAVRLDRLDVMDAEVFRRAAYDAGGQVDAAGFDEPGRSTAFAVSPFLAVCGSFSSAFRTDGTCGTIYGNHSAPP